MGSAATCASTGSRGSARAAHTAGSGAGRGWLAARAQGQTGQSAWLSRPPGASAAKPLKQQSNAPAAAPSLEDVFVSLARSAAQPDAAVVA